MLVDSHGWEFGDGLPAGATACYFDTPRVLTTFLQQRWGEPEGVGGGGGPNRPLMDTIVEGNFFVLRRHGVMPEEKKKKKREWKRKRHEVEEGSLRGQVRMRYVRAGGRLDVDVDVHVDVDVDVDVDARGRGD